MNTTNSQLRKTDGLMILFGGAAALFAVGTFTHLLAPLGISERTALIGLAIAGIAMCGRGPLGKGNIYGWTNPRHLFGYAVGVLVLIIAGARLFNLPLLWIASDSSAILAITAIMLVKILVAVSYPRRE